MHSTKLTFDSQSLVVKYLTFKFPALDDASKINIANYLFQLGFNSYQESGKLVKPILVDSDHLWEVCFVKDNPSRGWTFLNFSGLHASQFYFLCQERKMDWSIFASGVLSRLDLSYSRANQRDDSISVPEFLENCSRKIKQTLLNLSYQQNSKGLILKIGNRKSNHYSQISQGKDVLKFEYQMKGRFLEKYHSFLLEARFQELEEQLSLHFFRYFGKLLPLQSSYLDWLVTQLRPIRVPNLPSKFRQTDSIKSEIALDSKTFLNLLQFLTYAQTLDFEIEYLGEIAYRKVIFPVRDFLKFQNPTNQEITLDQLDKIKQFFQKLQTGTYVTSFLTTYFQSLILVPQLKLLKCRREKTVLAEIFLVEELFGYRYPVSLPYFSPQKLSQEELEVQGKFVQVFSSLTIEKEFLIKEFLDSYSSTLSNQEIATLKQFFLQLVEMSQEYNLIENKFKILSNNSWIETDKLTTFNISEGFMIYEKIDML